MKFSFIIPAYKSEQTLARCLEGILNQNEIKDGQCEIIIVLCQPSSELEKRIPEQPNIIRLKTEVKNRAFSRNLGASRATGEFLVFVDSDIYLGPDWLKNHTAVFENKLVAASQGRFVWEESCSDITKRFGFIPTVESTMFSEYGPVVVTGACIYRAAIFNEIGSFSEAVLWNEDLNLSLTAYNSGYAIAYTQSAKAILLNEEYSLKGNLKRSYKSAFYSCQLNKYYYDDYKIRETSLYYLKRVAKSIRFLVKKPHKKISTHYILSYLTKLLGYWLASLSLNKIQYDFPREVKSYKGLKKGYKEKDGLGLLYFNNKRGLYNTKNKTLSWIK